MKLPKIALVVLTVGCASAEAGAIKANLTGLKTQSSPSGVTSTPVSYNVTINTAKTGEIEGITIAETGSSSSDDSYSYTGSYYPDSTPDDPDPTPIPGTYRETSTYNSSGTKTSTYDFGPKSFGGKITSARTNTSSNKTTFIPDDTTIAPFVTSSSTSTPSSWTESYTDGGLASVKSKKGNVEIKLMEPYTYQESGYTETENTLTTIKVKAGKKPKMTLTYSDVDTTQSPPSAPTTRTTTASAIGKAKGDLDAKIHSGARKVSVSKVRK